MNEQGMMSAEELGEFITDYLNRGDCHPCQDGNHKECLQIIHVASMPKHEFSTPIFSKEGLKWNDKLEDENISPKSKVIMTSLPCACRRRNHKSNKIPDSKWSVI